MTKLIIIEIDKDGATVTRLNNVGRILPKIEDDDLSAFVDGGVTVSRVRSLTSADAASHVRDAVRDTISAERGSRPEPVVPIDQPVRSES